MDIFLFYFFSYNSLGSKDGFEPHNYHEKCDARGPLFTLIMSTDGFLFGGYTLYTLAEELGNAERPTLHPDCFMFTLTNPHALSPTTYPLTPGSWPTLYTPKEHAHLGWGRWGYDLALSKNPNTDKKSYFGFPFAFKVYFFSFSFASPPFPESHSKYATPYYSPLFVFLPF